MILSQRQLEEIAASTTKDFNRFFFGDEVDKPDRSALPTPIDQFAKNYLGLRVSFARLSPDGSICGVTAYADTEYKITELGITRTLALKRNQVILDESFIRSGNVQRLCAKRRCLLRYLPHYYNGGTAAIWQTAGKLFQKKNAMNHLFIAFLIPYSIFSLVVRPCIQQRLRGCCEDFDFSVRQLIQQRFKLHPLRGLALHSFTMKNLIHRDMIAGHQF